MQSLYNQLQIPVNSAALRSVYAGNEGSGGKATPQNDASSKGTASALAFLASCIKDHGAVEATIQLLHKVVYCTRWCVA